MLAGPIALFSLLISSAFAAPVAEQKPARRAGASVVSLGSRSTFVKRGSNVFDAESAKRELLKLKTKYSGDWSKPASAKTKRRNKSLPFKPKTGAEPFDVAPHRKRHRKENADAFGAAPATVTVTVTAGAAAADATSVASNDGAAANSSAASSSAAATGDASTLGQEALEGVNSGGVDILYFGNMTIGTPPQNTNVDFDTGSSDLILPVTGCNNCAEPLFAIEKSSTFKASKTPFSITFADQSGATGTVAQDTVTISGLTVQEQGFGALTVEKGGFGAGPNAGLIGLGFPGNAESKSTPFFFNLAQSKALASNVFSFFMTRGGAAGSELCLGCTDSTKFTGDITSFKLDPTATGGQQLFWNIPSDGFSVGNAQPTGAFSAVIDSGTSLIVIPTDAATALYAQIPGAADASQVAGQGFFSFPCDSQPTINLNIGGKQFDVNPLDFNLGQVSPGSNDCIGGIMGGDVGTGLGIVGDEFMKNWYSVFDLDNMQVGFAKALGNA